MPKYESKKLVTNVCSMSKWSCFWCMAIVAALFAVSSCKNDPDQIKLYTGHGNMHNDRAEDITGLRWTIEKPLQPGGKGSVSYRAKVK